MRTIYFCIVIIFLLLHSSTIFADIINVPSDYQTIQQAVNSAHPGDTIDVAAGTYTENIVIAQRLFLRGEDSSNTIIDGNYEGNCIEIRANRVKIDGFTIKHSLLVGDGSGIVFKFCDSCEVSECALRDNQSGVTFFRANWNVVKKCSIYNNLNGIYLAEYLTPDTSVIGDNRYNRIISNHIIRNDRGINFSHILSHHSGNFLSRNIIEKNQLGIDIIMSYGNEFSFNHIIENMNYGANTQICEGGGGGNFFHHNFITGNNVKFKQVYKTARDYLSYYGEGNFWDDFIGIDRDYDGIADNPFLLDFPSSNNVVDSFPLMEIREGPYLIYPYHKMATVETNVIFKWEELDDASGYLIEISTDAGFAEDEIIYNGEYSKGTSNTIMLEKGIKYYWRVREKSDANINNWSYVRIFTTGIDAPQLLFPVNETVDEDSSVVFRWEPYSSVDYYTIDISENENFSSLLFRDSLLTSERLSPGCINYNSKYYWRVRATVDNIISFWSATWSFKTKTMPPELISPRNDTLISGISIKLSWKNYNDVDNYIIEVSDSLDFSEIIFKDTVHSYYQNVTDLEYINDYFWRVKLIRNGEETDWSEIRHFKTNKYNGYPTIPELRQPVNNAVNQKTSLKLSWGVNDPGDYYRLQVAKDCLFKNKALDKNVGYSYDFTLNNLEFNTKYYWRVRSATSKDITPWSTIWNFTTKENILNQPQLIYPTSELSSTNVDLSFKWQRVEEATLYHFQLSLNDSFDTLITNDNNVQDTIKYISGLESSTRYSWRIKAKNDSSESNWSEIMHFTTKQFILEKPSLVYPLTGGPSTDVDLTFRWDSVKDAKYYHIQIGVILMSNIVIEDSTITSLSYNVNGLEYNSYYYWRISSKNDKYMSDWSIIHQFRTKKALGIENDIFVGLFDIHTQPNPFSESVDIQFNVSNSENISVKIYNTFGQLVSDCGSRYMIEGEHKVNWQPGNIPDGLYIIVINGESRQQTGTVIYLK